jgi:NAD(P)H-flavin reductase
VAFSGRGRTQWQKIWHVTILCMIGANSEGPLNFIERDYTPVSSSMGWEKGECVLLVKIYQNGKGTQWLNNLKKNSKIAISIPKTTLRLPSLNIESGNISYNPASVLLIVAGTGIAPAIQILEYFLNTEKPATLIYSARKGDILWVKRFEWMKEKKQNLKFVICSTPEQEQDEIFNSIADDDTNFPELQIGRITKQLIEQEIQLLEYPKIVISGPASFNSCVSLYCAEFNIPKDKISILDA